MIMMTDGLMAVASAWLLLGWRCAGLRVVPQRVPGSARPRNIVDFGGAAQFTPSLQPADQCSGGCSFISGGASTLSTITILLVGLFVPLLAPRWRAPATGLIGSIAIFGWGLRVAVGTHFGSGVIFAALLSVAITLILSMFAGMNGLRSTLS